MRCFSVYISWWCKWSYQETQACQLPPSGGGPPRQLGKRMPWREMHTRGSKRSIWKRWDASKYFSFLLLTWSITLCCHLYLQKHRLGKKQQGKGAEEPWPPVGDEQDRMGSPPRWLHNRETIVGQFFKEALLLQGSAISLLPMKSFFSFITS